MPGIVAADYFVKAALFILTDASCKIIFAKASKTLAQRKPWPLLNKAAFCFWSFLYDRDRVNKIPSGE